MTDTTAIVEILDQASEAVAVEGEIADGDLTLSADALRVSTGWELKPEGLCRGEVCVPVADRSRVERDGGLSFVGVAAALGRGVLLDEDAGVAVLGSATSDRSTIWRDGVAPELVLPDLDGETQTIEWKQKKRLLVAFASW